MNIKTDVDYRKDVQTLNPNALVLEGMDDCIIGFANIPNQPLRLAYNRDLVLQKMKEETELTREEVIYALADLMQGMEDDGADVPVFISND